MQSPMGAAIAALASVTANTDGSGVMEWLIGFGVSVLVVIVVSLFGWACQRIEDRRWRKKT